MDKHFDIEKMDRRTPYKVPDGFYDLLRNEVAKQVLNEKMQHAEEVPMAKKARRNQWRIAIISSLGIAASLLVLFVIGPKTTKAPETLAMIQLRDIEQAFNNLSEDDQNYYLEIYQDDICLSEE